MSSLLAIVRESRQIYQINILILQVLMLYLCIISPEFLEAIRSVKPEPPMRWKALVVDEHSQRILYNVLKRNDILEENISSTLSLLLFFSCTLKNHL